MAESVKEKNPYRWQNRIAGGVVAIVILIAIDALNGNGDNLEQFTDLDDATELKRRLAEVTAENNALEEQNADLKKQIADFDKKYQSEIDRLEDKIQDMRDTRSDRFDEHTRNDRYMEERRSRRPYWDRPVRGPDPRFYNVGGRYPYPVEYGHPTYGWSRYGPYNYPWWDDHYYGYQQQHPFYSGRRVISGGYPHYPGRGSGAIRIGASFPIGDHGRINIGFGRRW